MCTSVYISFTKNDKYEFDFYLEINLKFVEMDVWSNGKQI